MMVVRRRVIWPWALIGVLGLAVAVLLGSFVSRMFNPPVSALVEHDGPPTVIQVDIVNAAGMPGAGRQTMTYLRERGFDVVDISSATSPRAQSAVIDRLGDRTSALAIARVLGIADTLVISDIDSMMFIRASVILGKDYAQLNPFTN